MRLQAAALAVFVFATAVGVGQASASCSNASLQGVYGYSHGRPSGLPYLTGLVLGQFTADGKGNLTAGSWTEITNGASTQTGTFTGTYSIAKGCTGTLTFSNEDNSPNPSHFNIALDSSNNGFQLVQTDSGFTHSGFGVAQGTATCGLTGKRQTLAARIVGLDASGDPEEMAGQITLNGKGNVSGTITITNYGTISKEAVTGTYTQQSDCLGTMQITPKGFTAMNFTTVAVNGNKELLLIETDANTFSDGNAQQ